METLLVDTPREGFIDITEQVAAKVAACLVREGVCQVFVPHTTAGVTINEHADPDVVRDMLTGLDKMVPDLAYRHAEGNSRAHLKASLVGSAITVPIVDGGLQLGTWQGIFLAEFDGPRQRTVWLSWMST